MLQVVIAMAQMNAVLIINASIVKGIYGIILCSDVWLEMSVIRILIAQFVKFV